MSYRTEQAIQHVRIRRVFLFLVFTFALCWGFNFVISGSIGQNAYLKTGMSPLGMFFPAFVILLLQVFIFTDSPIYYRTYRDTPRWIFLYYFILTVLYGAITVLVLTTSIRSSIFQGLGSLLITLWTLLVIFLYTQCGEERFKRAGLQLGNTDRGMKCVLGVIIFLVLQAVFNLLFGLGKFPGKLDTIGGVPVPDSIYPLALIVFLLISAIGTPLAGLAVVFGEEYAWRGFLQNEMIKSGKRLGVLLIGLIWGIWHFPVILSGIHTYPPSVTGLFLGLIFFVLWGFIQSYAVIKTGSIWAAVFMHGVVNSLYSFSLTYLVRPYNKIFSFGLGIYGLAFLLLIVLIILRDPLWDNM